MNYETATEIEWAVANWFGIRTHIIVPNVSWGMFGYELDMCVLNCRSFFADEVEIKISKADLKRDGNKDHCHDRNRNYIRRLWFAMPNKMVLDIDLVPVHAGVIWISKKGKCEVGRMPKVNAVARKWDLQKAYELARLGTIRIWPLKLGRLQDHNLIRILKLGEVRK